MMSESVQEKLCGGADWDRDKCHRSRFLFQPREVSVKTNDISMAKMFVISYNVETQGHNEPPQRTAVSWNERS